jgi:hypothetical protein
MRAEFTVMALRQNSNPTIGKDQWRPKNKVRNMLIIFVDIKGVVHIEFALSGQTDNSAYYCDLLW